VDRVPISLGEQVDARFTRKGKGVCWPWNGSVGTDRRPQINTRDVMRFIYERERGPIPPGMILKRTDHREDCDWKGICSHQLCVNPWHVEPREPYFGERWGLYPRENSRPVGDISAAAEAKRRARARRKRNHDRHGDSQGVDDTADGG
jgi:hypothetical protein